MTRPASRTTARAHILLVDDDRDLLRLLSMRLQASAYRTDWNGFKGNLRPILLLAVIAVLVATALSILTTWGWLHLLP